MNCSLLAKIRGVISLFAVVFLMAFSCNSVNAASILNNIGAFTSHQRLTFIVVLAIFFLMFVTAYSIHSHRQKSHCNVYKKLNNDILFRRLYKDKIMK